VTAEHPTPLEKLPPEERRGVFLQATARLIVPAALVILAVLASTVGLASCDARQRSAGNRELIERLQASDRRQAAIDHELARQRGALARERRRADLFICHEVEAIKERLRASARVDVGRLNRTLEQLNIDPRSAQGLALLEQARAQERELLERFAPTDCRRVVRRP
jgi:hypothetical protein